MNQKRFEGKVALVTGGNSGIGLATAKRFSEEGADVIITGRDLVSLKKTSAEIGSNCLYYKTDVQNIHEIESLAHEIQIKKGRLDILFVNAGIAIFKPYESLTVDEFDRLINVNFKGVFFTIQKVLPLLSQNSSVIINASAASIKGFSGASVYSATKAAVRSLARTLTTEHSSRGIRFNVISPGPIRTPIFDRTEGLPREQAEGLLAHMAEGIPLKRIGTPEEIAGAVAFLASKDASYIAGVELFADGGSAQT